MKILVRVGTKQCENHCRRKGKGSLAMKISQGLVGPKEFRNRIVRQGNRLIFLYYVHMSGDAGHTF